MSTSAPTSVAAPPAQASSAPPSTVATRTRNEGPGLVTVPGSEFPVPRPSRTPRLLRRLQVVVAVVLLLAGGLAAWVITDLRSDLASAPELAQQYSRLGGVRQDLYGATDLATRSVLAGEPASGRQAKAAGDRLAAAAGLLVQAAQARPQDADTLTGLSEDVLRYAQVLSSALGGSRTEALPALGGAGTRLDRLVQDLDAAQSQLAQEASSRPLSQNSALAIWPALLLLGAVVWISWVVARLSHRVVNPGLAGAGVALVLVLAIVLGAQSTAAGATDASRDRQFTHVTTLAQAADGLDRAQRVLTDAVLRRSWNAAAEKAYSSAVAAATTAAGQEDLPSLTGFDRAGKDVAKRLAAGDWTGAAELLAGDDSSPAAAAAGFRAQTSSRTQAAVASAAAEPESASTLLLVQLGLALVLALAGAALGVLGLARRLQEYR